jgi:hemerythrin-like metal-binding protein
MAIELPFTPIEWSERMTTGVTAIDDQHRYLVATLKRATEKLIDDHENLLVGEIAKDLLSYAIMHFETEEALMLRHGYADAFPELARTHIAEHRKFSHTVVDICDRLREGRPVSNVDVLRYLNEWLRDHVLGIDQPLGAFVRQAEQRAEARQPS